MADIHDTYEPPPKAMTRHYVGVLVLEAVVILLLWALSNLY
jgi:hypothetical protein